MVSSLRAAGYLGKSGRRVTDLSRTMAYNFHTRIAKRSPESHRNSSADGSPADAATLGHQPTSPTNLETDPPDFGSVRWPGRFRP